MSQRFAPGDLITSAHFNDLLERLENLESRNSDARLILGQLGANTHTLIALGTGFEAGGGVFLDGQQLLASPPARGINVVILNPNLVVKFRGVYDTFANASESTRLANDLKTQTARYDVVIAVTHDAYTTNLQAGAKAALASVGGAALGTATQIHDNAAFIGVVPNNKTVASFNYLVSVIPADAPNTGGQLVSGLPFVWGIYSIPLQRFIMGGGSDISLPSVPKQEKESKDAKEKESKEGKDAKDKDAKEGKDAKDSKDGKDAKDKDGKEAKDKEAKESKDGKNAKDKDSKESKDKDSKEGKDAKDSKDAKDKDSKESKDTKDSKEASKDSKDNKDNKEDKEDNDKTGKETMAFKEKEQDQPNLVSTLSNRDETLGDPSVFNLSGPDEPNADLPLGNAFIPPQERPLVGRKALEAADKSEETR